jgi:CBS domain-containing protein
MEEDDVGTLVVVESQGLDRPTGILTDRDLAIRCLAHGLDAEETAISRVMSSPVHTIDENAPIEFALAEMAAAATRRLVVTGKGEKAVGVLSLDDLLRVLTEQAASLGQLLEKQRPHVPA